MIDLKKTGLPTKGLCIDWETSGYAHPKEVEGHPMGYAKEHQGIALGAIVFDVQSFEAVDAEYIEIKFDPKYKWDVSAEKIHGITREYLQENGLTSEDAAVKLMNFLLKYFLPDEELLIMGHNKSFDIAFLHQLLDQFGIMPKIWYRGINTCDIGIVALGQAKLDFIFEKLKFTQREAHNALEDAMMTLNICRKVKKLVSLSLDALTEDEISKL